MLRNKILFSTLLLSACCTTPAINTQVQRVEVPVAIPCKATVPTVPDYTFPKLTTDMDIYEKTQALLADRLLSLGYEEQLLAALNSCIK